MNSANAFTAAAPRPVNASEKLLALAHEAWRLEADGLKVIDVSISGPKPTLTLATSHKLANLVDQGLATYSAHGQDESGHWRKATLNGRGPVLVTWTERGN